MEQNQKQLHQFMDFACIELGYCLSKQDREEIAQSGPYTPADLARLILMKEGMDPNSELKHFRELRNAYIKFLQKNSNG